MVERSLFLTCGLQSIAVGIKANTLPTVVGLSRRMLPCVGLCAGCAAFVLYSPVRGGLVTRTLGASHDIGVTAARCLLVLAVVGGQRGCGYRVAPVTGGGRIGLRCSPVWAGSFTLSGLRVAGAGTALGVSSAGSGPIRWQPRYWPNCRGSRSRSKPCAPYWFSWGWLSPVLGRLAW